MNPQDETHAKLDAFKYLLSASLPRDEAIDALSAKEVDELLKETGFEQSKLEERIAEQKKKFSGRYAMMLARRRRIHASAVEKAPAIEIPATREAIIAYFTEHYGEEMPMAARNFKDADYDELRQLFVDLAGKRGPRDGR
jgi:hypothetical protein